MSTSKTNAYEKPALTRIDLAAEEVLTTGCKVTTESAEDGTCLSNGACDAPGDS